MKSLLRYSILCAFLMTASFLQGQETTSPQLQQAYRLRSVGQTQAAISILKTLLQNSSSSLDSVDIGKTWNLLGSSYQDLGIFDQARRCHEQAIQQLRSQPSGQEELASAIDNLGAVENWMGHAEASKALRLKAQKIYEGLGDHAGVARTSNNLAVIALHQSDFKAARRYLAQAVEEARLTSHLDDDDLAAMASVKGLLAIHEREYGRAATYFQESIEHWVHTHGENYFLVGLGYSFRAQASANAGDLGPALSDIEKAVSIERNSVGKDSPMYWTVEMLHVEILRAAGADDQASRLEKTATAALADSSRRRCDRCEISAESFR